MDTSVAISLTFILLLSIALGFELISKSSFNFAHSLNVRGQMLFLVSLYSEQSVWPVSGADNFLVTVLGTLAVTFAMINVVGGYMVTDRMLEMFKKKEQK